MVRARAVKALVLPVLACGIMLVAPLLNAEDVLVVSDFEKCPNNLKGEVGVYGSLEPNWGEKATTPYSWYYERTTPGYNAKNVHSGNQSFRLVNALGAKKDETWGSFSSDLGRTTDLKVTPKKVESKDVTTYKYLTFWVKGEKGGEKIEVLFRDSHSDSYMPQAKYAVPEATTEWARILVPLGEIQKLGVDLKALDNVGLAFGPDVGNGMGATIYIDDFVFTDK